MPLTSNYLFMCYDGGVYTMPDRAGNWLKLKRPQDVLSLNQLQYLSSSENIYFERWSERSEIAREFEQIVAHRPKLWSQTTLLVQDGVDEVGERYRPASDEERKTARVTLSATSMYYPAPISWLSPLKYRQPPKVFFNGTAVGHVRKAEWLDGV